MNGWVDRWMKSLSCWQKKKTHIQYTVFSGGKQKSILTSTSFYCPTCVAWSVQHTIPSERVFAVSNLREKYSNELINVNPVICPVADTIIILLLSKRYHTANQS